jgi:hypothetical protein
MDFVLEAHKIDTSSGECGLNSQGKTPSAHRLRFGPGSVEPSKPEMAAQVQIAPSTWSFRFGRVLRHATPVKA